MDFFSDEEFQGQLQTLKTLWPLAIGTKVKVDPFLALNSVKTDVDAVVDCTRQGEIDLIVVNLHAKKGIKGLLSGNFTEKLVRQSQIPVLMVNPAVQVPEASSRVLFPTDFGMRSRKGFETTVSICNQLESKLWLYYKKPFPVAAPFLETTMMYATFEEEAMLRHKTAEVWLNWSKKHGVNTELVFDEKPGKVDSAILEFSKNEKIELIVMVVQSGHIASPVLGSTTQQVLNKAGCPVWILHGKS